MVSGTADISKASGQWFLQEDDTLLERARVYWQTGEWAKLAALADETLESHPDRAKLSLLAAVGFSQSGDMSRARRHAKLAQDWGCDRELLARVLIGGVYNSLGCVASLQEDEDRAQEFFQASVAMVSPRSDVGVLGRSRNIHEKGRLGLLPEAAALIGQSLEQMRMGQRISTPEAQMLESQVELLNSMLALAQKRHQLSPGAEAQVPELESRATSQLGQDLWVLEQTGHKRDGFFVEFGATDGVLLSNTLLLEAGFGWRGICAEPNPGFFRKLQANRNCITAPDCILGQTGRTVEFILADEYGCVAEFADADKHQAKRAAFRDSGKVVMLQSISLDDFLKKYDAPRSIDYLSIDTEGSEYEILEAFPFEEWDIRLLTVEHNFTAMRADICALLERHGYVRTAMKWDDWYCRDPVS